MALRRMATTTSPSGHMSPNGRSSYHYRMQLWGPDQQSLWKRTISYDCHHWVSCAVASCLQAVFRVTSGAVEVLSFSYKGTSMMPMGCLVCWTCQSKTCHDNTEWICAVFVAPYMYYHVIVYIAFFWVGFGSGSFVWCAASVFTHPFGLECSLATNIQYLCIDSCEQYHAWFWVRFLLLSTTHIRGWNLSSLCTINRLCCDTCRKM